MLLEDAKYTIELSKSEVREITYHIHYNLIHSIDEHYNKLQGNKDGKSVFYEHERDNLNMMKYFLEISGYSDLYSAYLSQYNMKFQKKEKEREAAK